MDESKPSCMIVYLSGSSRGIARTLFGDRITIGTGSDMDLRLPKDTEPLPAPHHATLTRRDYTYELQAQPGQAVWVNGEQVERLVLASGDVIEVGSDGTVLRFRVYQAGTKPQRTVLDVFSDCIGCAERASSTFVGRLGVVLAGLPRELATQTSLVFRLGVLALVVTLAGTSWTLARRSQTLEERLADVTGLAELLARSDQDNVTRTDLDEILNELESDIASTADRLGIIEDREAGVGTIVRSATNSTILLQGSYGFRDPRDGLPVRLVMGPGDRPLLGPTREPVLTTQGQGPLLELTYTGTGFVASADGLILTNRHVAIPWESAAAAARLIASGLEPMTHRFVGYSPTEEEPFEISVVDSSDAADVAVVCCSPGVEPQTFLELSRDEPALGDEVVVLGYPLGLRALVVRADPALLTELQDRGTPDPWALARMLAERGYIAPLATRGIVGQLTERFVVYDAETTSGGSGGPVLGLDGRVLAINAAILPEFGGSNLGVPAREARALLDLIAEGAASPR